MDLAYELDPDLSQPKGQEHHEEEKHTHAETESHEKHIL